MKVCIASLVVLNTDKLKKKNKKYKKCKILTHNVIRAIHQKPKINPPAQTAQADPKTDRPAGDG